MYIRLRWEDHEFKASLGNKCSKRYLSNLKLKKGVEVIGIEREEDIF